MENNNTTKSNLCLRCVLKHVTSSKTYLMEAIQFGFKTNINVDELNEIIMDTCKYIIDNRKGGM